MKNILLLSVFASLSITAFSQITPVFDEIMIPMRDGEFLSADVYIPAGVDSCEVILIQTPYNKNVFSIGLPMGVGQNVDSQPFAWVIVDWRGFYGSNGADVSSVNRGEDGYDVCQWISEQLWHKDRIGTWGPSALGGIQYSTAKEQHPNHTCAVPIVAHPQQSYDSYFYGGVLEEARLEQLDALGYGLSPIIMANTYYSNVWTFSENNTWYPSDIHIPTLQIGGWYDHNIDKMMDWYKATRLNALPSVQDEQWLLVGPWSHGGTGIASVGTSIQGELTYPNAATVNNTMAWDFLNYYLLDAANNWQNTPLITYYETGKDVWNTTNNNSIEILTNDILYFDATNKLGSQVGISSTAFVSDPNNPAPTIGGANLHPDLDQGPYDQISLESRNDVITFSTEVLAEDVSVSGRISLDLFIEADQADCDVAVHLVDVYPDNRNMLITDGIKRMRFRNGYTQADETFMVPGVVYPVTIDLPFTNYTWLAGHKIKVYIGGNSSIRFNVNLQDGGPMYVAGTGNVANISLHHNTTYPSSISLPGNNPVLDIANSEMVTNSFITYPNPANNEIFVETDFKNVSYSIIDLSGKIIETDKLLSNKINVESLEAGSYIIQIGDGDAILRSKFVKL